MIISAQKLVINIQSIHDARSKKHQVTFLLGCTHTAHLTCSPWLVF